MSQGDGWRLCLADPVQLSSDCMVCRPEPLLTQAASLTILRTESGQRSRGAWAHGAGIGALRPHGV